MIGHNVSFDRSKISEEYNEIESGNTFLDTMSLHISTHGMTTDQRVQYKMKSENKYQFIVDKWKRHSSLNNLADCLNFYCPQEPSIDKSIRNVFVTAKKDEFQKKIVGDLDTLIAYCAGDVEATAKVFSKVFPLYCDQYESPISFYGSLVMGKTKLFVNEELFHDYVDRLDLKSIFIVIIWSI